MDNPGIAFLKQMHCVKTYSLVWGKLHPMYKDALLLNPAKDKTKSLSVFFGKEKQISIERHYLLPEKMTTIRLYFFFYILLRDKLIPFFSSIPYKNFKNLNTCQMGFFENSSKQFKEFLNKSKEIKGTQFEVELAKILKRCNFKLTENEFEFKSTFEMTRHELIAEFELFLGRAKQLTPNDDFINGEIPSLEINTNRDPEIWLNSIELAPENKRIFNLGCVDKIDGPLINPEIFGNERIDPLKWIGEKHIVAILNTELITPSAIRLKKCQKVYFSIKASRAITLNDCLSKCGFSLISSIFPQ